MSINVEKNHPHDDNDDVTIEESDEAENSADPDLIDIEESGEVLIKKLREKLKKSQSERQEFLDGWQRSKADFLNNKRRTEEEKGRELERIRADFLQSLLPLCDSFESAFRHSNELESVDEGWKAGIEQIYSQLQNIFSEYDLVEVEALDKSFDPQIHEALSNTKVSNKAQHDKVVEVVQKGYMIGDTLLRPAKVIIGIYK